VLGLPDGAGSGHADPPGLAGGVGETAGIPGNQFCDAVMRFGFRIRIAREHRIDDGLLPFFLWW